MSNVNLIACAIANNSIIKGADISAPLMFIQSLDHLTYFCDFLPYLQILIGFYRF